MDNVQKFVGAVVQWCKAHPQAAAMIACMVGGIIIGRWVL